MSKKNSSDEQKTVQMSKKKFKWAKNSSYEQKHGSNEPYKYLTNNWYYPKNQMIQKYLVQMS